MKQEYAKPVACPKEVDIPEMICVSAKVDATTSADASEAEGKSDPIWEWLEEQGH